MLIFICMFPEVPHKRGASPCIAYIKLVSAYVGVKPEVMGTVISSHLNASQIIGTKWPSRGSGSGPWGFVGTKTGFPPVLRLGSSIL